MSDLGIFGLEFENDIVILREKNEKRLNQYPQVCQNLRLYHAVNFGMWYPFFKRPGPSFSEGLGPGLGPLYKVCPYKSYSFNYETIKFPIETYALQTPLSF